MNQSEIYEVIAPRLLPGEKIIWAGAPGQGIRFSPADAMMIPFSLLWGGFAIFWEYQAFTTQAPIFFRLWGVPFVLVGLYMIVGRFFWDAWVRSRQRYALTDQRLLVLTGHALDAAALTALPQLAFSDDGKGSGTINFGAPVQGRNANWNISQGAKTSFRFLKDADRVFAAITQAQRNARY